MSKNDWLVAAGLAALFLASRRRVRSAHYVATETPGATIDDVIPPTPDGPTPWLPTVGNGGCETC